MPRSVYCDGGSLFASTHDGDLQLQYALATGQRLNG